MISFFKILNTSTYNFILLSEWNLVEGAIAAKKLKSPLETNTVRLRQEDAMNRRLYNNQSFVLTAIYHVVAI
ncbi:hypothetical protein [Nostoc sp. FACHB-133]|uniref:hypothetical protein n=1 Tax=Nostoc sp. FACHB-133 TaxID=2692835 RepID=UPI001689C049|nr:hypothetical protein [Nostoc sp. FACHB-133]MBD2526533.1 hypothetical protein [Nostoc sp. FACHB-133]